MKNSILLLALCFIFAIPSGLAQSAPESINYQAVIRDKDGKPMTSKNLRVRLSVLSGSATGSVEFEEVHTLTTTEQGLISLQLGGGTASTATFSDIDWAAGEHFLQVEVLDMDAGTSYTKLGTQQLVSVPYSLYANHAREAEKAIDMTVGELTDVNITTPANGDVLKWNGTAWEASPDLNETIPSGAAGGDLSGTYPDPSIKEGAVTIPKLDLSNDASKPAKEWMGLTIPTVDFGSTTAFPDNTTWGISGTSANGTIVYNPGFRLTNGFHGVGYYGWSNGMWIPIAVGDGIGGLGKCQDPGSTVGSLGCVTFTYQGKEVTYMTVRAADGNIWLQQNLGSKRVATSLTDADSYGDLFQFGRWDNGHQLRNSPTVATSTITPNNPAGIAAGNKSFIVGAPYWWATGAAITNTWSATNRTPSASNGIDPCAALGAGWRLPTIDEWSDALLAEGVPVGTTSATIAQTFNSNLKVSAAGSRNVSAGAVENVGVSATFWSSTAGDKVSNSSSLYTVSGQVRTAASYRGHGHSCRCLKK